MNTNEITQQAVRRAASNGLAALKRPEPMTLSEWAERHFYLSGESSYIEGRWESLPYQKGIMDLISNDDIQKVFLKKSARIGYTKIILAAMGYFAVHKKRNQAVWQPVDDDADEFVKTEVDPMLRDVKAVREYFPWYNKKSKHNTMRQKTFRGSTLHIRGGKAAKNYRRISVDTAFIDELEGFDRNVEREGSPLYLAGKRVEGSTFPKMVVGSTPKLKDGSLIEHAVNNSEMALTFRVPCPHCGEYQPLRWGGEDVPYGLKWERDEPSTAAYLCAYCAALFTQDEYLGVWHRGVWMDESGTWLDDDGLFRNADGDIVDPPLSVGIHIWTLYSSMTSWAQIVREFLESKGDPNNLRTFVNQMLGESWEEDESEKLDFEILMHRREHYRADVPIKVKAISCGIDTQDDRFERQVDGWGAGEERWSIDYQRLFGDPSRLGVWDKLAELLMAQYRREDGAMVGINIACMDYGGHYSDEVARFSRRMGIRFLIPISGANVYGKPVAIFPRKPNRKGVYLTEVGTDTGKELMYHRMLLTEPGPGYWHWPISEAFDETYFRQLTAEQRVPKWKQGVKQYIWDAGGRRNEPWDCSLYSLAAIRIAQQHMGLNLEEQHASGPKRRYRSRGIGN